MGAMRSKGRAISPTTARRELIGLSRENIVHTELMSGCHSLPLVSNAIAPGIRLSNWLTETRPIIEQQLLDYGAILFRGFEMNGITGFRECVDAISDSALEYKFRASPRRDLGHNIYTSTDYPSDQTIFPHNEHAYSPVVPLRLYFFCEQPAASGGETPIGSVREVMKRIDPSIIDRFEQKDILYVRNYGDGFGLPWQVVFRTDDKTEAEAYCKSVRIQYKWKAGDRLRTWQRGPAVVKHPFTGERIWFNHGTFFHVSTLDPAVRDGLLETFAEEDLPQNTYYGDGTPIEPYVLQHLRRAYTESMVMFPWQKGDMLILDNVLAVHARRQFEGFRNVLVAMGDAVRSAELVDGAHS